MVGREEKEEEEEEEEKEETQVNKYENGTKKLQNVRQKRKKLGKKLGRIRIINKVRK